MVEVEVGAGSVVVSVVVIGAGSVVVESDGAGSVVVGVVVGSAVGPVGCGQYVLISV